VQANGDQPTRAGGERGRRAERGGPAPRQIAVGVLAVVLVVFAAANFKSVRVNFLLFTTQARVVTVILVSALLGFGVGYVVGRPSRAERKRMRERKED